MRDIIRDARRAAALAEARGPSIHEGVREMSEGRQVEFEFSGAPPEPQAVMPWRAEWMAAAEALCRRLAVPLNHRAEVRLSQGPVLRGRLRLAEEQLWPEGDRHALLMRIGRATFRLGEMESVLRLDDDECGSDEPPGDAGAQT